MDLQNQLKLKMDNGKTRTFAEWTRDFVDSFYPDLGHQHYRVPALHFNQQPLAAGSKHNLAVLRDPISTGWAAGDLAHTFVLEKLEELSHHLQATDQSPLFIISGFSSKEHLVKLRTSGPNAPSPNGGEKQLPQSRPSNFTIPAGEVDILLLHKKGGIVMIEVKAVGHNRQRPEDDLLTIVQMRVEKAQTQLNGSSREILQYIMPDLKLPPITMVVALPNVPREQLEKVTKAIPTLDPNLRFLCEEDCSPPMPECPTSQTQTEEANSDHCPPDVGVPRLLTWWHDTVGVDVSSELPLDTMKTIVGRMCGLMSVKSVWTTSKPRMEVCTPAQAIGESGHRLADIVLLPRQAEILAQRSLYHLWLTGPMGSGKTLMLQLKGRQWLKEGKRVIVINVRTASRGRPQGHVLEESIQREMKRDSGTGSIERHDIALDEFRIKSMPEKLRAVGGPHPEKACFLIDEVLWGMSDIPEFLVEHCRKIYIWCVATYVAPVPKTFKHLTLGAVVRSPPSIQLMLRELDSNTNHTSAYTTRSTARGLPCDGPPIMFIDHTTHNRQVRPLDCEHCGNDLANIFKTKLGLKDNNHLSTRPEQEASFQPNIYEITPLSFRDVLILIVPPVSIHKQVKEYHWEASIPEALQFGMYLGMCKMLTTLRQQGVPFKYVVDNTQKVIAFPTKDEVIISDVMGAHSLERRVVVLLRSGDPLTLEEVTENISRYQTIQADPCVQTKINSIRELLKSPLDSKTARGEVMHLFVTLMCEIRDLLYPELKVDLDPSSSPEKAANSERNFRHLLGNMLVLRTLSFTGDKVWKEDPPSQQTQPASETAPSSTPRRRGMEYRCDVPMSLDTAHNQEGGAEASAAQRRVRYDEEVTGADSLFFVPGAQEDKKQQQKDVEQIQRAIKSFTEDDKDWEFFAASRCLSQYISIIS